VVRPVAKGMIQVITPINEAVGIAQQAMFSSSFAATPDIVRNVAKASDSRFTADTGFTALGLTTNLNSWSEFTQEYTTEDSEDVFDRTKLINDSRDKFSSDRNWDFFDDFWVYSTPFTKHKVIREGETWLAMDTSGDEPRWEWVAKDTAGFHTKVWRGWRGTKRYEVPIAWGAAYASDSQSDSFVIPACRNSLNFGQEACRNDFGYHNEDTQHFADAKREALDGYKGINTFRSISEAVRNPTEGQAVLRLKTEVSMDMSDVNSSDKFVTNQEPFKTDLVGPGDVISSISVAEVYYRRPEAYWDTDAFGKAVGENKRFEPANGYNPYWDVRLAAVESVDRLAALGMRGDFSGDTSLPGGVTAEALANYDPPSTEEDDETEGGGNTDDGVGTLPTFEGATLASVMGVPDTAVAALVAQNPGDFVAAAVEGFIPAEQIKEEIQDQIEEQVEDAARRILEAAWNAAVDTYVSPEAVQRVENLQQNAETALALGEGLSEQYERLRDQVQADFQTALVDEVAEYEGILTPLVDLVGTTETELENVIADIEAFDGVDAELNERRTVLETELAGYRQEVEDLYGDLRTDLTNYLMDRIEHYGRGFIDNFLPFEEMMDITDFLLTDYLETPPELRDIDDIDLADKLPWNEDDEG